MKTRMWVLAGAIAVTAALGLGTGLAAAQTQSSSPATSSAPTADATGAMDKMHGAMRSQMPEALRSEADAMHAEMGTACADMGAAMGSTTTPEAPPA